MNTDKRFEIQQAQNGPHTMPWHLSMEGQRETLPHVRGGRPAGPVGPDGVRVVVRRQAGTAWPETCVVAFYESTDVNGHGARDRALEAVQGFDPATVGVFTCPAIQKPNHARLYRLNGDMELVHYQALYQALMPYGGFDETRLVPLMIRGAEVMKVPVRMIGRAEGVDMVMLPTGVWVHARYRNVDGRWMFSTPHADVPDLKAATFEGGASEMLGDLMLTPLGKALAQEAERARQGLSDYDLARRFALGLR